MKSLLSVFFNVVNVPEYEGTSIGTISYIDNHVERTVEFILGDIVNIIKEEVIRIEIYANNKT